MLCFPDRCGSNQPLATTHREAQGIDVDMTQPPSALQQRVFSAADEVLKRNGSVGPLELLIQMRLLENRHFEQWLHGHPAYTELESHIQGGPEKLGKTFRYFADWAAEKEFEPIEFNYSRASALGVQKLQVTRDAKDNREQFYRTHFSSADASSKERKKAERTRAKAPEINVFIQTSEGGTCAECQSALNRGGMIFLEGTSPLCLDCADLAHLEFLPSGDAALTRRAKKHSVLSAVILEFNRRRKRYERRGLLVTSEAIAMAESECAADAPERAARRVKDAERREVEDRNFVAEFTVSILQQFPVCPMDEARLIAAHAAVRGSGRVGRTAAAKELAADAIKLAVIASIRHRHTNYDTLLMNGVARQEARRQIQSKIESILHAWSQRR